MFLVAPRSCDQHMHLKFLGLRFISCSMSAKTKHLYLFKQSCMEFNWFFKISFLKNNQNDEISIFENFPKFCPNNRKSKNGNDRKWPPTASNTHGTAPNLFSLQTINGWVCREKFFIAPSFLCHQLWGHLPMVLRNSRNQRNLCPKLQKRPFMCVSKRALEAFGMLISI